MTQRWVLYGDGLIVPKTGFGETLLDHLLLASPQATWQASIQGTEEMTLATSLHELSWRVIGKAPHGVVLTLGAHEIEHGIAAKSILPILSEILALLSTKTQTKIHMVCLPLAFFPEGQARIEADIFNQMVKEWSVGNVSFCDVNPEIDAFLKLHRQSEGEKRALHLQAARPTQLGRLILAQSVVKTWPWPLF